MKKLLAIVVVLLIAASVCGCTQTSVDKNADVTLTFIYGDANIDAALEKEEAARVIQILDGKNYISVIDGTPKCGFDENISLKVGNRVFAIACDTCNCVQDMGNLRYFDIPQEDMEYIHTLFEKYGGYFPCV